MPRNRPSSTARKVASDFLYRVEEPAVSRLAPAGSVAATIDVLTAAGLLKPWMMSLIRQPWYRRFADAIERSTMPGHLLHLVLRKRFIDDEVRASIARGVRQVLVVGAGYDTLCMRLAAEYPAVTFVELDHPPTHAAKQKSVRKLGREQPNLHLEGVDLGQRSLMQVMEESPVWQTDRSSAVVAEGVLMYLSRDDVVAFLEAVQSIAAPGSRLIATWVYETSLGRAELGRLGGVILLLLRLVGEPFRWGVDKAGIEPFLLAHGFRADAPSRFDLRSRYLEPVGEGDRYLSRFERVVAADSMA